MSSNRANAAYPLDCAASVLSRVAVRTVATRRFPGPAFNDLRDVAILRLDELELCCQGVHALMVVGGEVVDRRILARCPDLMIVANVGVGHDAIDVPACDERGVVVTNTPGVLDAATADLTFALLLACVRRVVEGDRLVRSREWKDRWGDANLATEVSGATLGIVGLGRIGRAVAQRAHGFSMRVLYHSRRRLSEATERELGVSWRTLDDLLVQADVVSLHAPLTSETENLVGRRELSFLRDGACLINTARAGIVDEPALVRELTSGRLRAGLDVFAQEPGVPEVLLALDNVVLSPHLGSATVSARHAMTRLAVENILAVGAGRPPLTPVSEAGTH